MKISYRERLEELIQQVDDAGWLLEGEKGLAKVAFHNGYVAGLVDAIYASEGAIPEKNFSLIHKALMVNTASLEERVGR